MLPLGTRFAQMTGDATHDVHGKLKKLLLAFAGTHFGYEEWCGTSIPSFFSIIGQESQTSLSVTYECMRECILEKWRMDIDDVNSK